MKNVMTGRSGEKRFSVLCSDAGLTCNESVEDDFGWDMLVEFPPRPQPLLAIDQRAIQTKVSVQIKTTKGAGRSVTISLDNALRYAKSPLPTFIVLVVLSSGGSARYFVKHVWTPVIGAWLLAAREADAREVRATNKERVSVTFDDSDEHSDDPLAWIENQVAAVAHPYATAKTHLCETIGFENSRGVAKITFEADGPDEFLDLQLGLGMGLRAHRFVFTSERFGILAARPEIDLKDVLVVLTPEGTPAIQRFEFPSGRRIAVSATTYRAAAAAEDGIIHRMRVETRCLDLIFGRLERIQVKARLQVADRVSPSDIRLFANLRATPPGRPIGLELEIDGKTFDIGSITIDDDADTTGWSELAMAMDALDAISASAARTLPDMSIGELNVAADELEILSALASERRMHIDFTPTPAAPKSFKWFLAYSVATVGENCFAAVVRRPVIRSARRKKRRQIYFGPSQILHATWRERTHFDLTAVQSAYNDQLERLASEGHIMALGDFRVIARQRGHDKELRSDLPAGHSAAVLSK